MVSAAGNLQHEQIVDLVRQHFADLPAESAAEDRCRRRIAAGEFREDRDLDQVHIVLGFPSIGYGDPDYYPTLLLSTLLGGGMSSRLFQEVREKRGLVYSIYSFSAPYMDGGLFGIYAGTGESEAEELMPVTLEELRKVQTAVTEQELARARAQVKASLLMSLESTGSRTEQLARQLQVFGRVVPTAETVGKLNAVTTEDVQRAAAPAVPRQADAGRAGSGRAGAEAGGHRGEAGGLINLSRATRGRGRGREAHEGEGDRVGTLTFAYLRCAGVRPRCRGKDPLAFAGWIGSAAICNVLGEVMDASFEQPVLLDVVALLVDLPEEGLARGQVGTVVRSARSGNRSRGIQRRSRLCARCGAMFDRRAAGPALRSGSRLNIVRVSGSVGEIVVRGDGATSCPRP